MPSMTNHVVRAISQMCLNHLSICVLNLRLEELERKLATDDNAGTRDMMQWLQPGRLGVKRAEESSYIR